MCTIIPFIDPLAFRPDKIVFGISRSGYEASENELKEWRNLARKNQIVSQMKNRETYLKNLYDVQFSIGDQVVVFDHVKANTHSKKFAPDWIGPYTLTRQLSRCTWLVLSDNNKFHEVHSDNIKKYKA